jgi:hypothetical protein
MPSAQQPSSIEALADAVKRLRGAAIDDVPYGPNIRLGLIRLWEDLRRVYYTAEPIGPRPSVSSATSDLCFAASPPSALAPMPEDMASSDGESSDSSSACPEHSLGVLQLVHAISDMLGPGIAPLVEHDPAAHSIQWYTDAVNQLTAQLCA